MTKIPLIEELDRLDLNRRRQDPIEEFKRIKDKQAYCKNYVMTNSGYLGVEALHDAFDRLVSTYESSVPYLTIGADRLEQLQVFGDRYGKKKSQAAALEHDQWIKEACRLWGINQVLSISDVANRVRENLNLAASHRTIRKAIAGHKPKKS